MMDKDLPWKARGSPIVVVSEGAPYLLPYLSEIEDVDNLHNAEGVSLKGWCEESPRKSAVVPILARAGLAFLQSKDHASPPRGHFEYLTNYDVAGTDSPIRYPVLADFVQVKTIDDQWHRWIVIEFRSEDEIELLVPFSQNAYREFVSYIQNISAYLKVYKRH